MQRGYRNLPSPAQDSRKAVYDHEHVNVNVDVDVLVVVDVVGFSNQ
jgi:hypothetical protein